jgi:hypothetical protein
MGSAGFSLRNLKRMKTYVLDHATDLQYGPYPTPESRYTTRAMAEVNCLALNQRLSIGVGTHRCSFAVDALSEGGFGIICVCHPLSLRMTA